MHADLEHKVIDAVVDASRVVCAAITPSLLPGIAAGCARLIVDIFLRLRQTVCFSAQR